MIRVDFNDVGPVCSGLKQGELNIVKHLTYLRFWVGREGSVGCVTGMSRQSQGLADNYGSRYAGLFVEISPHLRHNHLTWHSIVVRVHEEPPPLARWNDPIRNVTWLVRTRLECRKPGQAYLMGRRVATGIVSRQIRGSPSSTGAQFNDSSASARLQSCCFGPPTPFMTCPVETASGKLHS